MLKPAENRLNYSELLTPPSGYEVEFAIGTTYALDLQALVGVPLALSLSEEMDQTFQDDPIYVLEGLRRSADKFAIFCEAGQIKIPQNQNSIFAMMEDSVFEVALENNRSFHPKVWLIKYQNNNNDVLYRLLVLTRNLTFDRSWDIAIALEGKRTNNKTYKNKPLADFFQYLVNFTGEDEKRGKIKSIISELDYIQFDPANKYIPEFDFFPLGITGYGKAETGIFEKYHQLIVISPFISESTISELNELELSNAKKVLITRKTELQKLTEPMLSHFEVFTLKDSVIDGESVISGDINEGEITELQDIHAKLYARTKSNQHHIYIGSANSSRNAFHGNVEFLIKLKYKKHGFRITDLLEDMFGDEENPFERIEVIPEQEEVESDLADLLQKGIKQLCRTQSNAFVVKDDDDYSLNVRFEDIPVGCDFSIGPLLSTKELPLQKETSFEKLSLLELGNFYKITATKGGEKVQRVIKIKTYGIPEEREKEIFRSIIKDSHTFLKYVAFLLSDDFLLSVLENLEQKNSGSGNWDMDTGDYPALYENMLKTAARSPEKLEDVENIINIIEKEDIIPTEFQHLYQTFIHAAKKVKK
ncbi:phospholipase D family protein [Virgibacillus sp. JSM 102003]|uniref:phospholipase D family protein n=1 Tax=Virgibacillus sp. JSM 102003 TaxID=1562108 RepID=UPI0035BFAF63